MLYNINNKKGGEKLDIHEFSKRGVAAKKAKAEKRRAAVAKLKNAGMSGPQIAEELGEKLRTIYQDFSILKQSSQ